MSNSLKRLLPVLLVLSTIGWTGCTINRNIMFRTPSDFAFDPFNPISDVNYRIAPNDLISFQLYANKGERLLSMTAGTTAGGVNGQGGQQGNLQMMNQVNRFVYEVRPDGTVELPELGAVQLSGLNID